MCLRKRSAVGQDRKPTTPQTQALSTNELPMVQLSEITHGPVIPAPTVNMQVSTCHGEVSFNILPDSGADISAAGPQFVLALGEHVDNLAPSNLCPRAVNGSILHPLGKLPHVTFCVNGKSTHDDVHIYDSIKGALVSWASSEFYRSITLSLQGRFMPRTTLSIPSQPPTRSWQNFHQCSMDKSV